MAKTKQKEKYKKTVWGVKKAIWRVRVLSEDGLLKVPKDIEYGHQYNIFNESEGYESVEAITSAINEKLKKDQWLYGREFVAIPFFDVQAVGEVEEDP